MLLHAVAGTLLQAWAVSAVYLWKTPGDLNATIPASCRAALSTNITCSELIPASFVAGQYYLRKKQLDGFCAANCTASIKSFQSNANTRCGNTTLVMNGTTTYAWAIVDPMAWANKVACLKDTTDYCLPRIINNTLTTCSDCFLKYSAGMLESPYGRARANPDQFSSLLSTCSKPSSSYPYTTSSVRSTPVTTVMPVVPTCSSAAAKYTVATGDTCVSISAAKSVSTDNLISLNGLDYNCTTIKVGNTLCLGATCATRKLVAGDTCDTLLAGKTYFIGQLLSWNPTIHSNCDNLASMVGRYICVSPPGSTTWDATPVTRPTPDVPLTRAFNISFVPGPTTRPTIKNVTTPFLYPTKVPPVPTTSISVNGTQYDLWAARRLYCPISDAEWNAGWSYTDLAPVCADILDPYCFPDPNKPAPTSTKFPAMCTPSSVAAASTTF